MEPDSHEHFMHMAAEAKTRITEIPPDSVQKLIAAGAILLDVRETEEFEDSHLTGARHIPRALLAQNIHALVPDPATPIICYCAGGNRGALAADTLQDLGYGRVVSIQGGIQAALPVLPSTPQSQSTSPQ